MPQNDSKDITIPRPRGRFKIMVVDDDRLMRELLQVNLSEEYDVEFAVDGLDALEKIKAFKPDMFIIDTMMPRMDGIELTRMLRHMPAFAGTPIAMLTARNETKDKIAGFAVDIDDYITKPFNILELTTRIKNRLKKGEKTRYLSNFMSTIGIDHVEEIDQLGYDIKAAANIQLNMMPTRFPVHENFTFGARMIPAKTVGGDFYDFIAIDPERVAVCIGDVSGKGIQASLLMVMVRTLVRALLAEKNTLPYICDKVNAMLIRDVGMGKFVTMMIAIVNLENGLIESYVNAGHLPPIVIKKGMRTVELNSTAPFLGAFPDVNIEQATYELDDGDVVCMYTDGVTEAESPADEFYGDERFVNTIKELAALSPDEIVDSIFREISDHSPNKKDDITMVVMKYQKKISTL